MSSRRSGVVDQAAFNAALNTSSPLLKAGVLQKRGYWTWHARFLSLHQDGTLLISNAEGEHVKYALRVSNGLCVAEQHGRGDFSGWRLTRCDWCGQRGEPDGGLELSTESYSGARQWLLALKLAGAEWDEDVQHEFELLTAPPQPPAVRTPTQSTAPAKRPLPVGVAPPRILTRSASRALHGTRPPRYVSVADATAGAKADEALELALHNGGRCLDLLAFDALRCLQAPCDVCASAHGQRALVRLLDAAAIACVCANVISLHNFAEVLLSLAAALFAGAALVTRCADAPVPAPASHASADADADVPASASPPPVIGTASGRAAHAQLSASAQLAEWAATLAVLGALALHRVSETAHSVAVAHRVWIAFGLAANMAGLLVQLGVVASLATAMALTAGVRSHGLPTPTGAGGFGAQNDDPRLEGRGARSTELV